MPGTILKQLNTTPQTSGTAVTTGNSNWSSLSVGTSNTHQHNDSAKMGQPAGYRLAQGGANSNIAYLDLDAAVAVYAFRMPFKYAATPTVSVQIARWYSAADHVTTLGTINILSTNRVSFVETGASGFLNVTSPSETPLAPNTDYVVDGLLNVTANTAAVRFFARGSSVALFTLSGTLGADMAAAAGIASQRFGIAMSGTAVNTGIGSIDTNSAFALGSGDYLVRHDVSNTLTVTANVSPTSGPIGTLVSATLTAAGGNGNTISYTVDWGDGQTTGPQSSNSFTHTYNSAGTFNGTATATQAA